MVPTNGSAESRFIKILLVTSENPNEPLGGLGTFVGEFAAHLRERTDIDLRVMLISNAAASRQESETSSDAQKRQVVKVNYVVAPAFECRSRTTDGQLNERAHFDLSTIYGLLGDWTPDIIHCNDRTAYLPFRFMPNVVFSLHLCVPDMMGLSRLNDKWFAELQVDKTAAEEAKAFIVYSRFMRDRTFRAISWKAAPIRLPLGADLSGYYQSINKDRIVVAYFGRLVNLQKNVDAYVEAVNAIDEDLVQSRNVHFRLYGKAKDPERFLSPRIPEARQVLGEEKYRAYAEADIVVMPSDYEPFGFVGLEAIASGCILLATPGLGMDEYLKEGKNYVPISPDSESIRQTLTDVLEHWEEYRTMQESAPSTVSSWTWERSVDEHVSVYHEVLSGRIAHRNAVNTRFAEKVLRWRSSDLPERAQPWGRDLEESLHSITAGTVLVLGAELQLENVSVPSNINLTVHDRLPEYMPFADEHFESVIALGEVEFAVDVPLALVELRRVCSGTLILGIHIGPPRRHQVFAFENVEQVSDTIATTLPDCRIQAITQPTPERVVITIETDSSGRPTEGRREEHYTQRKEVSYDTST